MTTPLTQARESLQAFRELVPLGPSAAPAVSGWSVGEQLHHAALVAIAIAEGLGRSRPPAPRHPRSLLGQLVLWRGRIPRGRARAPSFVLPTAGLSAERLTAALDQADAAMTGVPGLPPHSWIRHRILGVFRRDDALRFIAVHTNHHLHIAQDILERAGLEA